MADFEDATSATWDNVIDGQLNLLDAVRGEHRLHRRERQARTRSATDPPRSSSGRAAGTWCEKHLAASTAGPSSASLVDFGLYFFHSAAGADRRGRRARTSTCPSWRATARRGCGTTSSCFAQERLGMPAGHHPGDRADRDDHRPPSRWRRSSTSCASTRAGLNAGRWDYIFSVIKTLRRRGRTSCCRTGPQVTMTMPFMRAYTELLVATCHRRGRPRDRRDGGVHPEPRTRRSTSAALRRGRGRTSAGRPATVSTAPGWRTRAWSTPAARRSTRCWATGRTSSTGCGTTSP